MIFPKKSLLILALLTLLAALTAPALAVIDVKDPLSKQYATGSEDVYVGTIQSLDPDSHVLTLAPFTAYKGASITADSLQILLDAPADLRTQIKIGQPVAIFQVPPVNGRKAAVFHIADHWYAGLALDKPGKFRINTLLGKSFDDTFPGKTPALVKVLDELKAGKYTLLDAVPEKLFPAPVKETFTLPANATAFAAFSLPQANFPCFAVITPGGLKILQPQADNSLRDVTKDFGVADLKPTRLAAGMQGGVMPVLLIDSDVYPLEGGHHPTFKKFAHVSLPNEKILALAIDDLNDDGELCLAVLTSKDLVRIRLESLFTFDSATSMPASAPASQPAPTVDNAQRLTAKSITAFDPDHKTTLGDSASLAAVDLNNDHRPDLILLTPTNTLTLLNRGFGGFLINKDQAAPLLDPAATGKPQLPLLAATPNTLYLLQKDGTLYRYNFPNK